MLPVPYKPRFLESSCNSHHGYYDRQDFGIDGEVDVVKWFTCQNFLAFNVHMPDFCVGRGPSLALPDGRFITSPDLMVARGSARFFVEVKHKHGWSRHRKTDEWTTVIDRKYYDHYLEFSRVLRIPVLILFLIRGEETKDDPPSPPGLFGGFLEYLDANKHHEYGEFGHGGSVYWSINKLKKYSDLPLFR